MSGHRAAPRSVAAPNHQTGAPPSSLLWLFGLGCGAAVALDPALAILLTILLVPSCSIRFIDGAAAFRRCLPFGLAAAVSPTTLFWHTQGGLNAALDLAGDPKILALAWGAQGGGWLLGEILPLLIAAWLHAQANQRKAALKQQRRRYEREWGLPPPTNG